MTYFDWIMLILFIIATPLFVWFNVKHFRNNRHRQ